MESGGPASRTRSLTLSQPSKSPDDCRNNEQTPFKKFRSAVSHFKTPNPLKKSSTKTRTPSVQTISTSVEDIRNFFLQESSPQSNKVVNRAGSQCYSQPKLVTHSAQRTEALRVNQVEPNKRTVCKSVDSDKARTLPLQLTQEHQTKHLSAKMPIKSGEKNYQAFTKVLSERAAKFKVLKQHVDVPHSGGTKTLHLSLICEYLI